MSSGMNNNIDGTWIEGNRDYSCLKNCMKFLNNFKSIKGDASFRKFYRNKRWNL